MLFTFKSFLLPEVEFLPFFPCSIYVYLFLATSILAGFVFVDAAAVDWEFDRSPMDISYKD